MVHQVAKFYPDCRKEHGEAVVFIFKYLQVTRYIRLWFKPDTMKDFQCFCDADFVENWNIQFATMDPNTAKSRSGWTVFYLGWPIIWASKL